jgi:hypothetical protein
MYIHHIMYTIKLADKHMTRNVFAADYIEIKI